MTSLGIQIFECFLTLFKKSLKKIFVCIVFSCLSYDPYFRFKVSFAFIAFPNRWNSSTILCCFCHIHTCTPHMPGVQVSVFWCIFTHKPDRFWTLCMDLSKLLAAWVLVHDFPYTWTIRSFPPMLHLCSLCEESIHFRTWSICTYLTSGLRICLRKTAAKIWIFSHNTSHILLVVVYHNCLQIFLLLLNLLDKHVVKKHSCVVLIWFENALFDFHWVMFVFII